MNNLRIKTLELFLKLSTSFLLTSSTIVSALNPEDTPAAAPIVALTVFIPTGYPTPTSAMTVPITPVAGNKRNIRIIVPHSPHDDPADTARAAGTEITTIADRTSTAARLRASPKSSTRRLTPRPGSVPETHIHSRTCAGCFNTKITKHTGPKKDCAHCIAISPGTCDCLLTRIRADTK